MWWCGVVVWPLLGHTSFALVGVCGVPLLRHTSFSSGGVCLFLSIGGRWRSMVFDGVVLGFFLSFASLPPLLSISMTIKNGI